LPPAPGHALWTAQRGEREEQPLKTTASVTTSITTAILAALAAAWATSPAAAQAPPTPTEAAADFVAVTLLPAKGGARLSVSSPAFPEGGDFPFENTGYRGNIFPGLKWSAGPAGVRSYAVVMQDADGLRQGDAILHWTLYNLPPGVTVLPAGMTAPPPGAVSGPNIDGPNGSYLGPRSPAGPKHRYHLQVFALDTVLPVDPQMSWPALKAAMKDHVIASGQTIGLGQIDPTAPPRPPGPPPK
jgi:para-nitrobenzyl esterase